MHKLAAAVYAVVIVAGISGCSSTPSADSERITESIPAAKGDFIELIIYDSGTANMKGGDWAEFRFPKLFADNNGVAADKVIEDLNESILDRVGDFQDAVNEAGDPVTGWEYELDIKVTDIFSDSNLLIVNLRLYEYLGNAHGFEELWTKAYRVSDQSEIFLESEIERSSLNQLSDLIATELEWKYPDSLNFKGVKLRQKLSKISSPFVWEISTAGVSIWLPAYSYTAGYVGHPQVSIGWQEFGKLLREDSVLRRAFPSQINSECTEAFPGVDLTTCN